MTDHDQFFKNLLQEFFGDLLRIVVPELAPSLRAEEPTFLESELFTSFPRGRRRQLDLAARVEAPPPGIWPSGFRGARPTSTWHVRSLSPGAWSG